MLHNLPYFWNTKIHDFSFHATTMWVFAIPKIWQIMRHLIKHKPLISEECTIRETQVYF